MTVILVVSIEQKIEKDGKYPIVIHGKNMSFDKTPMEGVTAQCIFNEISHWINKENDDSNPNSGLINQQSEVDEVGAWELDEWAKESE
jgi:hypothetical protein